MKTINAAIITTAMISLSSCQSMLKTEHHVTIDHNININVNAFEIGLNHSFKDTNQSGERLSKMMIANTISNLHATPAPPVSE